MNERKDVRLKAYDYSSAGAYFITICTQDRRCILSDDVLVGGGVADAPRLRLTEPGMTVEQTLLEMDRTYDYISIDNYVIMPNHVHLLVSITDSGTSRTPNGTSRTPNGTSRTPSPTDHPESAYEPVGAGVPDRPSPANAVLPAFVSTFKRFTNRKCGEKLWQRSYYEHVIRNDRDYEETWNYIENNPAKWIDDRYYQSR